MTANQIAYWNTVENRRSNQAREVETNRANLAKELAQTVGNNISRKKVENDYYLGQQKLGQDRDLRRQELEETYRHNINQEAISRAGVAANLYGASTRLVGTAVPYIIG